jgi:nucleotide-binding universal stress UspA family protein
MKTIVVGYDESEASKRALERAAQLAKAFESTLVITSVAPVIITPTARSIGIDPGETFAEHLAELSAARAYVDSQGLHAEYVEASGHPGESILAAAQEHSADMIVVGTREAGLLERLLGGSVSAQVSQRAHCDVLIVH